jgi:hypothetical protein
MTNWLAFSLGAFAVTIPSILWFLVLVWNAPELCDELREDDASGNVLRLDVRRGEAKRMLTRMRSELPQ